MSIDFDAMLEETPSTTTEESTSTDQGLVVEEEHTITSPDVDVPTTTTTNNSSNKQPTTTPNQTPVRISRFNRLTIRTFLDKDDRDNKDTASLSWSIRAEYPRITVYTNNSKWYVDNKIDYNYVITAPFDIIGLEVFLGRFESVIKANPGTKYRVDCLNTKFENGTRTKEIYTQATVICGKDNNGIIYLAVLEEGKAKIKFDLLPSRFFKYYDANGVEIKDKSVLSQMYATAYLKILRDYLYTDLITIDKTVK